MFLNAMMAGDTALFNCFWSKIFSLKEKPGSHPHSLAENSSHSELILEY